MPSYPEIGEFVIATVTKIMPYGAFCSIDEYGKMEAFLHISEVSTGWVKNIREYVREGQKVVVMISRVDHEKRQVDVSLKRVSDNDRKRKLESYQLGQRAEKLLERAALKLKKNLPEALKEAGQPLIEEFGDLYPAFEAFKAGTVKTKLPPAWMKALKEVADSEIKEKRVHVRAHLTLQSFDGNGIEYVKDALVKVAGTPGVLVRYLGAPRYYVDVENKDYKSAEKTLSNLQALLEKEPKVEFSLQKVKA